MISSALIVAVGITASGQRQVLGIEVGDSEDESFWTAFLRRLRERGLAGAPRQPPWPPHCIVE